MWRGRFRVDLGLVRQGVHLAWEFGVRPLEEMTRIAELLQHTVYERGSLVRAGDRLHFTLLNPPLRMGAFVRANLYWDGARLSPESVRIVAGVPPVERALAGLSREAPLLLPSGERAIVSFPAPVDRDGEHAVRLELHSAAIPPAVWFEFSDRVAEESSP